MEPEMLTYVWKLLRARWRITFNNIWRAKPRRKIGILIGLMVLAFVAVFLAVASWGLLSILRRPELSAFITPDLIRTVPVLFTSATFLVGLLTNFGVLLQSLYLAGDMEFLLAAPIPPRAVFVSKLVQAVLPNFLLMSLFNLPALIGLGVAQGYNVTYFVVLPVTLVLLMLAGAGVSAVAVMAVVRAVPARRVAEVLGLVGGVVSILCSQSGQFMRFSRVGDASPAQAMQVVGQFTQFNTPYSPLAWPGRALVALGEGQWPVAILFVGLTTVATLGAFAISLATAERLYVTGWARTRAGVAPRKAVRGAKGPVGVERRRTAGASRLLPAPFVALIVKDAKVLRRDLRNLSQLITPIVLGVVYTVSLASGTDRVPSSMFGRGLVSYGGLGTAIFVSWLFAARLALGGIGMEGKRYWLLKVAPLRPEILLVSKFVVAYLPSLALGSVFLVAGTFLGRSSSETLAYNWIALAATIAAGCGVYLAFGTIGANLRWEDPRQITRGTMGCAGQIAGMVVMGLIAVVFVGIPMLLGLLQAPVVLAQVLGLSVGLVLSVIAIVTALLWARGRVALIGEE
jgi:ABC-2 type transport system permease protein